MQRNLHLFGINIFPDTGCHVPHSLMVFEVVNSLELKQFELCGFV